MSEKHMFMLAGLIAIGIGIRSIIKQEASWTSKSPHYESMPELRRRQEKETTHYTGPIAVIIGIIWVIGGVFFLSIAFKAG
jgi:beta-lactamase regulating signal transducer with metallopeptidase domain